MKRPEYIVIGCGLLAVALAASVDVAPTAVLRNCVIRNAVIAPVVSSPCQGAAVGDSCGGGKYAGELNGYKYVVTPGGCTNSSTPTCAGGSDTVTKVWANNSGTTAYGVNTGATSTTDGPGNTTLLATNYTDTDAAKYCQNMEYGGYTDWFLPAKDELNFLYPNKATLGGFVANWYWSSTEGSTSLAWGQGFGIGSQFFNDKSYYGYVRCLRRY